jgi:hypothetical protein
MPILVVVLILCGINPAQSQVLTPVVRVNGGGEKFGSWQADQYFTGGFFAPERLLEIENTDLDYLYQTERWTEGEEFIYEIPVPGNGYYRVDLLFAEIFHGISNSNGVGARVFNVYAESALRLINYDIFLEAGGPARAIIESLDSVLVSDGSLSLRFSSVVENAKISAIEILKYTLTPIPNVPPDIENPGNRVVLNGQQVELQIVAADNNLDDILQYSASGLPSSLSINPSTGKISGTINSALGEYNVTVSVNDQKGGISQVSFKIKVVVFEDYVFKMNAGGSSVLFGEETWVSDEFFIDGIRYTVTEEIGNTDKDLLYQSERFGSTFTYEIPVPQSGIYSVILHFAEIFWENAGERIFSVDVENGQGKLNNYDIVAVAGGALKAVSETFRKVNVNDGFFTIVFTAVVDNAKVSAIEIANCLPPDTGVSQTGNMLTASANGAIYQWVNCASSAEIPGATGKTFTPETNGTYAVKITQDGCTGYSVCINFTIVGLEVEEEGRISVYPNPGQSYVKIELPVHANYVAVDLTDVQGKSVMKSYVENSSQFGLNIESLTKGMYIIHIRTEKLIKTVKLVVN